MSTSTDHYVLLSIFCLLLMGAVLRALQKHVDKGLQFTVMVMLAAVLLQTVMYRRPEDDVPRISAMRLERMDPHLFLYIFLPPLLFESSFEMDMQVLWQVKNQVLLLAVPGVLMSTFLTGCIVDTFLEHWEFADCVLLGAIVSATDPVAVVSLLHELGASKKLGHVIEGESLLNDGTAMVVFLIVIEVVEDSTKEITAGYAVERFLYKAVVAVLLGWVFAFVIMKIVSAFADRSVEITAMITGPYLLFWVAEHIEVSGVIAVVCMGLVCNQKRRGISPEITVFLKDFLPMVSFLANTLVFAMIGIQIAAILAGGNSERPTWRWFWLWEGFVVYIIANLTRAVTVTVMFPALKALSIDPTYAISGEDATLMVWGGLRGAVSLILALLAKGTYDHTYCHSTTTTSAHKDMDETYSMAWLKASNTTSNGSGHYESDRCEVGDRLLFYTAGVVFCTLVVNAPLTPSLMRYLGLDKVGEEHLIDLKAAALHFSYEAKVQLASYKHDPMLANADWDRVRSRLPNLIELQSHHERQHREHLAARLKRRTRSLFGSKDDEEMYRPTDYKEQADRKLELSVRKRFLRAVRQSGLNAFISGKLSSKGALMKFNRSCDHVLAAKAISGDEKDAEKPGPLRLWEDIEQNSLVRLSQGIWYTRLAYAWLETRSTDNDTTDDEARLLRKSGFGWRNTTVWRLWQRLYRRFLTRMSKSIILKALGRRYDLTVAMIHGCHKALEMSDGLAPKGRRGDEIINQLRLEADEAVDKAVIYLQRQTELFPEIVSAIETEHATRQLLTSLQHMIYEAHEDGFIDEEDEDRFVHKVRSSLDNLRRYPPYPRKAQANQALREISWVGHLSPEAFDDFRAALQFEQDVARNTNIGLLLTHKCANLRGEKVDVNQISGGTPDLPRKPHTDIPVGSPTPEATWMPETPQPPRLQTPTGTETDNATSAEPDADTNPDGEDDAEVVPYVEGGDEARANSKQVSFAAADETPAPALLDPTEEQKGSMRRPSIGQRRTATERRFSWGLDIGDASNDVQIIIITKGMVKIEVDPENDYDMLASANPPLNRDVRAPGTASNLTHGSGPTMPKTSSLKDFVIRKTGTSTSEGDAGNDGTAVPISTLHRRGTVLGEAQMVSRRKDEYELITAASDKMDFFWMDGVAFDKLASKYPAIKWSLIRSTSVGIGTNLLSKHEAFSSWKLNKLLTWVERNAHIRIMSQYPRERREEWPLFHVTVLISGGGQAYGAQKTSSRDMSKNEDVVAPCVLTGYETNASSLIIDPTTPSTLMYNFDEDAIIMEVYDAGPVNATLSDSHAADLAGLSMSSSLRSVHQQDVADGGPADEEWKRQAEWMIAVERAQKRNSQKLDSASTGATSMFLRRAQSVKQLVKREKSGAEEE